MGHLEQEQAPYNTFPIAPIFANKDHYDDGTPTLTAICNAILSLDEETEKYNHCVYVGSLGVPICDLRKPKNHR
jgi:hypothetical protein